MFKLIVLSAFVALAAAAPKPKPGFLHEPLVAAPITKIVQPAPLLVQSEEQVGSYLSHIPTGVSAYSSSVVHGAAPVVSPVITPVQKFVSAPIVSEPIVTVAKAYAAPAPIYKTIQAPTFYSQPIVSAPQFVKTYAAAPAFAYSHAPIAYNAPIW